MDTSINILGRGYTQRIFMSRMNMIFIRVPKITREVAYGHDLYTSIILHLQYVSYLARSGCREKGVRLTPAYDRT